MTYPSKPPGELVHYGVKGMKWGVRGARRLENQVAKNKTRAAVRDIESKPISKDADAIKRARAELPSAANKYANAKDQYKVDKKQMNRHDAKRPMKIASAELDRIQKQADRLTPSEQKIYNSMQLGRAVSDLILRDQPRSEIQKLLDRETDRQRSRSS